MKRLLLVAVLALGLGAGAAGVGRADSFDVAPATTGAVTDFAGPLAPAPVTLPASPVPASLAPASALVPNDPSTLVLPPDWTTPPAIVEQLSIPQLQALWQQAGAAYGIPWQVLGAINKVESNFGGNMGPSSAGAIGWMQFMPDTWLRWGTDANGDGVADPWNPQDAVYSAARYLAASGGQTDIGSSVFSYNHAQWYVDEVLQLAQLYGAGGLAGTVDFEELQQRLADAEQTVVEKNQQLVAAVLAESHLADREAAQDDLTSTARFISGRLAAQRRAVQLGARRQAVTREIAQLRRELADAQAELEQARAAAQPASFSEAAGQLLAAPTYEGSYVFPVGGGPGVVSVSHQHHDYPAADIAAPTGTPVYALLDGTVLNAWSTPDPKCGIGMTFRTSDGQTWTYCHLAYLEPTVVTGATLAAGAPVGLVGETGDATGPHLHLQLDPQSVYPQSESWFEALAGRAFRWQDEPTPQASALSITTGDVAVATATATASNPAQSSSPAAPTFEAGVDHPVFSVVPNAPTPAASPVVTFTR